MRGGIVPWQPGHTYAFDASYGCTRRTATGPYKPSQIEGAVVRRRGDFAMRSAEECPRDDRGDDRERTEHDCVVEARGSVLAVRIESHGLQVSSEPCRKCCWSEQKALPPSR